MTLDMYFGSLALATLPSSATLATFLAIMVAGGLLLNVLAYLYNAMIKDITDVLVLVENMGDSCDQCGSVDTIEAAEDLVALARWQAHVDNVEAEWLDSIRCPGCLVDYVHGDCDCDDVYMGDLEFLGFDWDDDDAWDGGGWTTEDNAAYIEQTPRSWDAPELWACAAWRSMMVHAGDQHDQHAIG